MFQYILFDLDGTLTDPGEGITKSIRYAFEYYGFPVESLEELEVYIGPPLRDEFMMRLGVDEKMGTALVEKFRERYNTIGWKENYPIEGMPQALERLKEAGCHLAVATSKPYPTAMRVLERFDMAKYFDVICASDPDGGHADKALIVGRALKELGVSCEEKQKAIMVGDRMYDIIGGVKNDVATLGLTMGYGSLEEFQSNGVSYIADSAAEMVSLLLQETD